MKKRMQEKVIYSKLRWDCSSDQPTHDFISALPQRKAMKQGDSAGRVDLEEEEQEATEDQSRETE